MFQFRSCIYDDQTHTSDRLDDVN